MPREIKLCHEDVQLKRGHTLKHVSSQLSLLQQHFWWSLIIPETSIEAPAVSHQAPGSLQPSLSIPHQPWSHTAWDCVTELPLSKAIVVDHFSRAIHIVPMPQLPSDLLIKHAFRLNSFPRILFQTVAPSGPPISGGAF